MAAADPSGSGGRGSLAAGRPASDEPSAFGGRGSLAAGRPASDEPSAFGGRLIDISPPISPQLDVWPGDQRFEMVKSLDIIGGDHIDVGAIRTTLHVGSHVDAHRHFARDGADAASMPLEHYYGPCQVIEVDTARGQRFGWDALRQEPTAPRVLLKTGTFPDPMHWNSDFAAPEPALIDTLADRGVVLVGFDSPSTDLIDDAEMLSHRRLVARGVANLEGVVLKDAPPGHYTLCAFPLRIVDGDGSPVRAVLIAPEP